MGASSAVDLQAPPRRAAGYARGRDARVLPGHAAPKDPASPEPKAGRRTIRRLVEDFMGKVRWSHGSREACFQESRPAPASPESGMGSGPRSGGRAIGAARRFHRARGRRGLRARRAVRLPHVRLPRSGALYPRRRDGGVHRSVAAPDRARRRAAPAHRRPSLPAAAGGPVRRCDCADRSEPNGSGPLLGHGRANGAGPAGPRGCCPACRSSRAARNARCCRADPRRRGRPGRRSRRRSPGR